MIARIFTCQNPLNSTAMSGLEIAGLVLGVLPIAVKALQTHKHMLSSYKRAARLIRNLEKNITTELRFLKTTCETLLDGIALPHEIDAMLGKPFGPAWKQVQINQDLRIRLGDSYASIEEVIEDLHESVKEL